MIAGARLAAAFAGAIVAVLMLVAVAGADTKPIVADDFFGIDLSGGIKAAITPGEAIGVTAQSSRSGDIQDLKTSVVDGVFHAWYDWNIFHIFDFSGRDMTLAITMPELDSIAVSGGSSVNANSVASDDLKLDVSGGATVRMIGASAKRYTIAASGGASVAISGTCYNAAINASGGATVTLRDLVCADVTVAASGGAHIVASATASASGTASGGGDVAVYGHPALTQVDASGGGHIDYPQ
jgi:Putative auto-transporter adhesin, head GIN domain